MAIYKTLQSGNMLDASTWGLVNAASYLAPVGTTVVTLTTSYQLGTAFNPGVCEITEIGVALGANTNTAGTITLALHDTATVAGTEVTMNCADLPQGSTTVTGGWIYFKLPSPVTLASTNYQVKMLKSAGASAAITFRTPTGTANYARQLVTTATGTPTTADETHIAGNTDLYSGSTQFVMTMNNTASTQFGAMSISKSGHVKWGTSASTAYLLTVAGDITGYIGFEWTRGDRTTRCPATSSMEMVFVNATITDRGFNGSGGTFTEAGSTKTSWMCRLNTDEAIASTSLGVDTNTGWLDNDECVIASSTRTASQSELFLLNGNAGASTLTIDGGGGAGGGLANAHEGNVNTVQSEIVNMSRNVNWRGTSATLTSYINLVGCVVDTSWASYKWLGSGLKRGFQLANTTQSGLAEYCVFRDGPADSYGFFSSGPDTANVIFRYNLTYDISGIGFIAAASSINGYTVEGNINIRTSSAGTGFYIADLGATFTNNTSVGGSSGILFTENNTITGTVSGNIVRCAATSGMTITASGGTISNTTAIRNGAAGLILDRCNNTTIDGGTLFGNFARSIMLSGTADSVIKSFNSNSDTGYLTGNGIETSSLLITKNLRIISCNFSQGASPRLAHTNDVTIQIAPCDIVFENCLFGAVTRVSNQSSMLSGTGVGFSRIGGTAGVHAYYKREGTHTIDTTIFETTPSLRMTPSSATGKLASCGRTCVFRSAVASGSALTVSVRVRESVAGDGTAYNGAFPRLLVKRNISAGITADTVLATATSASEGAWETISGTTATVTDDAILEFAVDCDGTAGWINIENWTVTTTADSRGMKYWVDGAPIGYNNNVTPDFPDVTNVLTTDTVDGVQGTYNGASADDVRLNTPIGQTVGNLVLPVHPDVRNLVGYGSNGTEYTGSLEVGASPVAPTLLTVVAGNEQFTATFTATGVVKLAYKLTSSTSWTIDSQTVTGDGSITVAALNQHQYQVFVFADDNGVYSLPSATYSVIPMDPAVPTPLINPNWTRWIFASVCKHFNDRKGALKLFIEGQYRDIKPPKDHLELRVDGPMFTEVAKNCFKTRIDVNVLVHSSMDNDNYHRIYDDVGLVSGMFTTINLYKYGSGPFDTQEHFGCLTLLQDTQSRNRLEINHFGQIEPRTLLVQATVDGHYQTELSN